MGKKTDGELMALGRLAGKSFVLRIAGAGMTYAFVVALARIMSVEDFGVVGTLMSGALLFSVIGCVGQRAALLRFVPPLRESGVPVEPLLGRAFRLAMIGNAIVYLGLVCAAFFMRVPHFPVIAFGLLMVPLTGMIDMQAHLARSYSSLLLALVPKDILWRMVSLCLLFGLFVVTGEDITLRSTLAVLVGVLAFLIVSQGWLMRRKLGVPGVLAALGGSKTDPDPVWAKTRIPLWISSVAAIAFTNLDVVAAGLLIGPDVAAVYFAVNRIAMVPSLFMMSYNIVVGPLFSGHFAAGRSEAMRDLAQKASVQVFIPTLVVVAGFGLSGHLLLQLFGRDFEQGLPVLRVLLLASLVNGTFGPGDLVLSMCGEERRGMRVALVGTIVGAVFILCGAFFGTALSLAIGVLCAVMFARTLSWLAVYKSFGFSVDAISGLIRRIH